MAKKLILLLSTGRGGTHFVSDLILSAHEVYPLIELGIFWQLYHKSQTAPDVIASFIHPDRRQDSGINFQHDGPYRELGRSPTYRELFWSAAHQFGILETGPVSLDEANAAFAQGLDSSPDTYGFIFNKFTLSTVIVLPNFTWSIEDITASLDYLYQFFEKNPAYSLTVFTIIRNPFDIALRHCKDFLPSPA